MAVISKVIIFIFISSFFQLKAESRFFQNKNQIYLKIGSGLSVSEVKTSIPEWRKENNIFTKRYEPVDSFDYLYKGRNLTGGNIILLGLIDDFYLRIDERYFYLNVTSPHLNKCLTEFSENDEVLLLEFNKGRLEVLHNNLLCNSFLEVQTIK